MYLISKIPIANNEWIFLFIVMVQGWHGSKADSVAVSQLNGLQTVWSFAFSPHASFQNPFQKHAFMQITELFVSVNECVNLGVHGLESPSR